MTDPGEGFAPNPPSRRTLLMVTGGGFLAAALMAVLFVLPVELGVDLTGFGKLTGLGGLARPKTVAASLPAPKGAAPTAAARNYATAFRSDVIEIPLDSPDTHPEKSELEYKVRMKPGSTLVYSWAVSGVTNPEEFYFDFHGENPVSPTNPKSVVVAIHDFSPRLHLYLAG